MHPSTCCTVICWICGRVAGSCPCQLKVPSILLFLLPLALLLLSVMPQQGGLHHETHQLQQYCGTKGAQPGLQGWAPGADHQERHAA